MDEREWVACDAPSKMLKFLQGKASGRKLRCFAFACGRRYCVIWEDAAATDDYFRRIKPAVDELCRRIIDAAERMDDGQETADIVENLRQQLWAGSAAPIGLSWDITATIKGDSDHWVRRYEDDCLSASEQASRDATELWKKYHERLFQAALLRDIFGNPFRSRPSLASSLLQWNRGTVKRLAEQAYQERLLPSGHMDPQRLAVLADAAKEAGAEAELIEHLRGPGPHARGCHVVDLLTCRE